MFETGDLYKLWSHSTSFEKAFIATAAALGWEINSALQIETGYIKQLLAHATQNNQSYIYRLVTRSKEETPRLLVLNPLAITCLTAYFQTNPQLADDRKLFPYTVSGTQKLLIRLAKDSGLACTGSLRFHNIRKWLMSKLSYANFNEFQIKFIMGKSIGRADRVYLQTLQREIEEKYPTIYDNYLNIAPQLTGTAKQHYDDLKKRKC
jgi:hypothetical protein